ncbi:DUF4131 domain-containing protein [Guptibacillus hwajinpoensis]|uniref:DUF4131 domain-containing protein n=1 Tax=Guptibacillus hwajinpoensis TaxID=208199 RepID=UPI003D6A1948
MQQLKVGLTCQFSGEIESPSPFRVPSLFDYKQYLYHKKIHWLYTLLMNRYVNRKISH